MRPGSSRLIAAATAAAGALALAACAAKPPPPPAPPPVVRIPPRPYPPMGASPNLVTPVKDAMGVRRTINVGLSGPQTVWNLRSAYNVAALNCQNAAHSALVPNYGAFLKTHARELTAVNKALDSEFKARHGTRYISERESFQTEVYNYFALPPLSPSFCDATLALSQELLTVPAGQLGSVAPGGLSRLEAVFSAFYDRYDQYRADLAAWNAKYGASTAAAPIVAAPAPGKP